MKKLISDKKRDRLIKNFTLFALILLCLFLIWILFNGQIRKLGLAIMAIVIPAIAALFISYLFEPLLALFVNKCKMKKPLAVTITMIIIIVGFMAALTGLTIFVYRQANLFAKEQWPQVSESVKISIQTRWPQIYDFLNDLLTENSINDSMIKNIDINKAWDILSNIFSSATGMVVNILLTIIFTVYFLYDRGNVFKGLSKIFPSNIKKHLYIIGPRSNEIVRSYFRGKIIAMFFLFIILSVGFLCIGLGGYGILFALILACLDIIPIVGPFIGVVIPVLYSLIFRDSLPLGIYTSILVLAIELASQFIQEKVISPRIIGKQMKINSLLLLCSMLFFQKLLGVAGIILAIPICGIIKVVCEYIYEEYKKVHPEFLEDDDIINENQENNLEKNNEII